MLIFLMMCLLFKWCESTAQDILCKIYKNKWDTAYTHQPQVSWVYWWAQKWQYWIPQNAVFTTNLILASHSIWHEPPATYVLLHLTYTTCDIFAAVHTSTYQIVCAMFICSYSIKQLPSKHWHVEFKYQNQTTSRSRQISLSPLPTLAVGNCLTMSLFQFQI
jgi:hypothetical protein